MAEPIRVKPPEAASISITETAEFRAAVQEAASKAAAEAVAAAVAQFATVRANTQASPDMMEMARSIGLAIAELSHQGDKRDKPVDPKVLAEREAGLQRMNALIDEAIKLPKGDPRRPKYKCMSRVILKDHVIDPYRRDPATKKAVPVEFTWCLDPNDAMVPLNDMAKRIFAEFRTSRGNKGEYAKNEVRRTAWLTDGGLLIEGAPPVRREIMSITENSDVLDVSADPFDPNATHVRVLGTSHPPARQYNADNPV